MLFSLFQWSLLFLVAASLSSSSSSSILVQGAPYMILISTRSKCVSVIAPQGQTITIQYDVPDMKLAESDEDEDKIDLNAADSSKLAQAAEKGEGSDGGGGGGDGMDQEWNRRMKEKLERMKSKKMRDMSITVTQKNGLTGALASRERRTYTGGNRNGDDNKDGVVTGQGRIREELSRRQGAIEFLTGETDGSVDICVQSIIANKNNPSRVALRVTMGVSEEKEEEEEEPKKDSDGNVLAPDDVKTQMSRLERDIQTLTNRVKAILNNADFNKNQEAAFHQQSVAMNTAATYWPIIQVLVLLVTGFTQANHIVRFMKSRHIGA